METIHRAVVLVSGGLDSATVLAIAQERNYEIFAISFDYGQRHQFELQSARKICQVMSVEDHLIFPLDLRPIGGSALTDTIDVPKDRNESEICAEIPVTYVPARNTIFLSIALGWAEVLQARDLFIGVNAIDYSGYPDCRPEFIHSFEQMANCATKAGVNSPFPFTIQTPLIHMTKSEIIATGMKLGVDYSLTHSCYHPNETGLSCGRCDACQLRLKGFHELNLTDPIPYQS